MSLFTGPFRFRPSRPAFGALAVIIGVETRDSSCTEIEPQKKKNVNLYGVRVVDGHDQGRRNLHDGRSGQVGKAEAKLIIDH